MSATVVNAIVWVCPRCLGYYASSSAGDLHQAMNRDAKGKPTFPRSRCPVCGTEREPHYVEIELPDRQVAAL
jgi:rubrerythrin